MGRHGSGKSNYRIAGWIWAAIAALIAIVAVVIAWTVVDNRNNDNLAAPECTGQKFDLTERDLSKLADAFRLGDEAALRAVQSALAEGRTYPDPHGEGTYQSNPAHFLQHIIVHDSHHRGQVLSLLRLGGRTPEQMDALDDHWAIWRE